MGRWREALKTDKIRGLTEITIIMAKTIAEYNRDQVPSIKRVCDFLESTISQSLKKSESKIWHGTPVWFIEGNPIVSYSVRKSGAVSLMFFSGQSFDEELLKPEGKFKAAEIFYTDVKEIKVTHLKKWLRKAQAIQWDYKNIVKMKGVLVKLNVSNTTTKTEKICSRGHVFAKSKDIPTCPVCWPGRYRDGL